jgi:hypothetical protein
MYVRVDTSLDCASSVSQTFRILDGLFISLYLGIPAIWLLLLLRRKAELNPAPSDLRFSLFLRDRDVSLNSLRFLFDCFRPEYYYFEVVEMSERQRFVCLFFLKFVFVFLKQVSNQHFSASPAPKLLCRGRRVVLIGVIPLMSEYSARRATYAVCLSLCSWAFYREVEPFRMSSNNALVRWSRFAVKQRTIHLVEHIQNRKSSPSVPSLFCLPVCITPLPRTSPLPVSLGSAIELRRPGHHIPHVWGCPCDRCWAGRRA